MASQIDRRADIHPNAEIDSDVCIGPWTVIGPKVTIGSGTEIASHVIVQGPVKIGKNNKIFSFASVGTDPQHKQYHAEETWLEIGDYNVIRECCTINRGTMQDAGITRIGHRNLFMTGVHIAHDCIIHNDNVFANYTALSGHVTVYDSVNISGYVGVHQYCSIGSNSLIAKGSAIRQDVLPYVLVDYDGEAQVRGLNTEGLRRRGFDPDVIMTLKKAYKIVFRENNSVDEAMSKLIALQCPAVDLMIEMMKKSTRGILR